jgi:RNA polymerase sigma-70 factor (sigma-E family)
VDSEFSAYVAARRPALVRSAVLLGCSVTEAEDLVQTALVKTYRHWGKVSRAGNQDGYVYRILVNAFRDSRRRRWNAEHPVELTPEEPVADRTESAGIGHDVRRALRNLGADQRIVLVLRFYADLTNEQVAETLGVPVGTVKSRVSRGLAALSHDPSLSSLHEGTPS